MRIRVPLQCLLALPCLLIAQAASPQNAAPERQPMIEAQIARKIQLVRQECRLPPLEQVPASKPEVQLTCSAALTGKEVHDPMFGNLETYVSDDLGAETKALKLVALGVSTYSDGSSRRVYSDKDDPRYSVVVFADRKSEPGKLLYRIGVARRESAFLEFIGPIAAHHPIKDSSDWKQQVDPACRRLTSH